MSTNHRLSILITAATVLAWTPAAFPASPATGTEHEQHHPEKRQDKPPVVAPGVSSDARLDAQIAHLRAIRERLSRAKTPEERQALLVERHQVMQDAMAIMQKDMMKMGGPGRMAPGKGVAKGSAPSNQMQMCHDMAGSHMAFMQEMMQTMANDQGMGPGMGPGMGGTMAPGKMMGK
ncbi:hypothetical protein [Cupriavidus necator]